MKKYARIKSTGDIRQVHAIDFPNESEFIDDEPELNDNQKIVLEWLKRRVKDEGESLIYAIYLLGFGETVDCVFSSYIALTNKEQAQVLKAFAEWGLEQWQTTDTGE